MLDRRRTWWLYIEFTEIGKLSEDEIWELEMTGDNAEFVAVMMRSRV
jgi:hypothetical protein